MKKVLNSMEVGYRLCVPAPMSTRADGLSNDRKMEGVDRSMEWTSSFGGIAGWLQASFGSGMPQSDDAKYWRVHHLFRLVYLVDKVG